MDLGTVIAVIQLTSSVISICYDYRQGVKSSSRDAILITDELNSLKDVLESLLRLIENTSDNGENRLATFESLAKEDGLLVNAKDELERLKIKLEPQKGWRAVKKTLQWPLKEGEMRKALEGLERLKSTIQLALSADQAALALDLRTGVDDLTRMFQRRITDQTRQDLHAWLAAPDPYSNHVASRKKRQANTGTWLLRSKPYVHWLQDPKTFLWLYGIPGSGKTVLCSTVIEQLVRYCEQIPRTAIAYFYFNFNDTEKRDIGYLVRSLITQLSAQCESTPAILLNLYQSHKNGRMPVDDHVLIATLRSLVLTFHNAYIVFDALDERSDCEEILQFIHTIEDWDIERLHLAVTSRQLPEIEESLSGLVTEKVCLHDSELNEDIVIYVADKLQNDKTLAKWPPEIRLQIQNKLLDEEGGMFQWVICQLDMLRRCMSVNAIRKQMSALPKSLDETYDRILLSIDEIHQPEVMKTLQALTVTVDVLTPEEIVEILAVDLEATPPRFEPDSRLLDPRSVLSMCSSLVTASRVIQWKYATRMKEVSALRLAHASVADYLTRPNPSGPLQFHYSRLSARQFMAQSCLAYLLNPEFASNSISQHTENRYLTPEFIHGTLHHPQVTQRMKTYPFLQHATSFWPMYLERKEGDPEDHLTPKTKEILQTFFATSKLPNGGNFAAWVAMLIPSAPSNYVQNTQPLYYASSFGLTEVVRIILSREPDIDINALGGRAHSTALHVATYRDHIDVVRLLLEKGADPSIPNDIHESPMYWASVNGNDEMEELLSEYDANWISRRQIARELGKGFGEGESLLHRHVDEHLLTRSFRLTDSGLVPEPEQGESRSEKV